jgi:CRISPR-associated endonuclease Csn1
VEIEHILPFSRTLDNSAANRTLTMRFANRAKGNKSPFEVFGSSPEIAGRAYEWDSILVRAQSLPPNKSWRFSEDAMARFEDTERDFIARQLTDTQYLSRIAREYLTHICAPDNIWVIPGRMTAMLRGWWGLNSILSDANRKDRTDHRHHAIDAAVAAATDRGLLQRIAREAARAETEDRERVVADTPLPWDDFRDELRDALQRTIVSHRADHGQQGKLHEETAYGIIKDPEAEDGYNLVYRKPFAALNKNEIARIRDVDLRVAVEAHVSVGEGKLDEKLRAFGDAHGIRRVRLLKKEQGMIHVSDTAGAAYKALSPGDNHHIDIIALPGGIWAWWAVTVFAANQTAGGPPPWKDAHPAGRRVMRLHKGDLLMLATTPRDEERIMRIQRLSPSNNTVYLVEHFEAGDFQKRHDDPGDSFRWLFFNMNKLKDCRARRVSVDEIGRVRDPGFKP